MTIIFNILILFLLLWGILTLGKFFILLIYTFENDLPITYFTERMMPTFENIFDFSCWDMNWFGSMIKWIVIIFFIIVILITLVYRENIFDVKPFKDKYQRQSYTKFQGRFERKRGLYRVQYDNKGEVTRYTLECIYDKYFDWILNIQNKIMAYYNRPLPEYWNRQKVHKIPKTKPIKSLNVYKKEKEDKKYAQ